MTGAFGYLSFLLLFNLCQPGETEHGEKSRVKTERDTEFIRKCVK